MMMMPPADRIHEQNEQDPSRVMQNTEEDVSNEFLAVGLAVRILQLYI